MLQVGSARALASAMPQKFLCRSNWKTEGRDPLTIRRGVNLSFNVRPNAAAVEAESDRLKAQWGPGYNRVVGGGLLGTPDQAVERIKLYQTAGATDINVALRAPWDDDMLKVYLDHIIPEVRRSAAPPV